MKARHQINFKRRRPAQKPQQQPPAKVLRAAQTLDVTTAHVQIAERELKFARALSDTERQVRDSSLQSLQTWLEQNGKQLQPSDIDRLWKALFYCIWMADKRPIITSTISAVVSLSKVVGWPFLQGLFRCLSREWFGIDKHRIDKYYELVNAALKAAIESVVASEQDDVFIKEMNTFLGILETEVWDKSGKGGLGIALHVLDVYVDKVLKPLMVRGSKLDQNESDVVFDPCMQRLYTMLGSSESHLLAMGKRAEEQVFHRLVNVLSSEEVGLDLNQQRETVLKCAKRVFKTAADKSTCDDARKGLYDLHAELKGFVHECDEKKDKPRRKKK